MGKPKQEVSGLAPLGSLAEDQARIVNERIQDGNREGVINQQADSLGRCLRRLLHKGERELSLELATLDGTVRVTMTRT